MLKNLYIIFLFLPLLCFGQVKSIGIPSIKNYSKAEYNASTQNWGITQDQRGFMYFANNQGLLRFDGVHWDLTEIVLASPVRSVFADSENNVYVGVFNDFGVLVQDEPNKPKFKSLKSLLPANIGDFDDIWRIFEVKEGIVFQCYEYVFILKNDKVEVLKPRDKFHFSFAIDSVLYVNEPGVGLYMLKQGELEFLNWSTGIKDKEIISVMKTGNDQLLVSTAGSGVFKYSGDILEDWNPSLSKVAEEAKLYSATELMGEYYAFGTILDGLIIANSEGEIVQNISVSEGLQNNTILSVFADNNQNLWLGLDDGIDYVEVNSPISFITDKESLGTGYCCRVFKGNIYFGTNQGLFVKSMSSSSFNKDEFKLVENTAGQVWSLEVFDGQLICGHNLGTFIVEGNKARVISEFEGAWKYIRLKDKPEYLIGGHYDGLTLLKKGVDGWQYYGHLEGFSESSRYLNQDKNGDLWISHGGKGVFKIKFSADDLKIEDVELYTENSGLPSSKSNIVFAFESNTYISTIQGVFEYNEKDNKFYKLKNESVLGDLNGRLRVLEKDGGGNYWYITNIEAGVLRLNEDLTYTKISSPFKQLESRFVNEFEFIYPYDYENVFMGIDNGFAHYSSGITKSYSQPYQAYITKVELPYLDSVIFQESNKSRKNYVFPYKRNSFRFLYTAPFLEQPLELKFSYYLENYSERWSDWTSSSYKDFTNLRYGEYVFKLKAKNLYDLESNISSFSFIIAPPWYRSVLAYYSYVLLVLLVITLTIKLIIRRIKKTKLKEKERYQQELLKSEEKFQHQAVVAEKEIIRLRNEKLRSEMVHRDKELANQTMSLIQKNKFLTKLEEDLNQMWKVAKVDSVRSDLKDIVKKINRDIKNEQHSKVFNQYFDEVHQDFLNRLKEKHKNLTPNDLRLCAYLKMNLATKEIAPLMNVSVRGLEISRYRLRKKLGINRNTNLTEYILGI